MPDQSKKTNQPKKATGSKGEATGRMNGKSSGSGGNSSTETTSGGGGNAQATSSQPQQNWEKQTLDQEPPLLIEMTGRKPSACPKELSNQMDKDMQELEDKNQPGNDDNVEGKGKGKGV
ncbi:hypothetical protein LB505_004828 [Fusarium chuoi]|nr:hypothetical protein LB505_004828 [Fusarium chuoi]